MADAVASAKPIPPSLTRFAGEVDWGPDGAELVDRLLRPRAAVEVRVNALGYQHLCADGPVFECELAHRKVLWIAGCESAADRERRRRYEAVGLGKSAAPSRELASPLARLPPFRSAQRDNPQTGNEGTRSSMLARLESPNGLFHVDRARIGHVARFAKRQQPAAGVRTTAKDVDEDSRVEEDWSQLSDTARITAPLVAHPASGILVPVVPAVRDRAEC